MSDPSATPSPAPSFAKHYGDLIHSDAEAARRELRAVVAAEPERLDAWSLLATAYVRSLDFAPSAGASREVLKRDPDNKGALQNLALCLYGLGDLEGALEVYRQLVDTSQSSDAVSLSALLLHRLGRFDEAEAAYDTLLTRAPLESLSLLGGLRGMMGLLRDTGRPLASDGFAHELLQRLRRDRMKAISFFVSRDNATAFHEWFGLVDKSQLADLLTKGAADDPEGARVPATFNLPRDRMALVRDVAAQPPGTLYIVKPKRGSGGQGISVAADLSQVIGRDDVIVQRYVERPYLVEGRKGHLRIYGLITSTDPLRAYVYSEGIVRFAPEPYDPRPERLAEVAMHVTNTALHVGHPGLLISQDADEEDVGTVRSVSALLRRLEAEGRDADAVFGEIKHLVGWFLRLLRREGMFARQGAGAARSFAPKLFGLDVLLDADAKPWLIEVQSAPATVGSPLVTRINGELYKTVFEMSVGRLIEDGMTPEAVADVLSGPEGIARRELEIELGKRGRFEPLDLD